MPPLHSAAVRICGTVSGIAQHTNAFGKLDRLKADLRAIAHRHMDSEGAFNLQAGAVKAVYLAPTRALVQVSCCALLLITPCHPTCARRTSSPSLSF